MDHALASFLLAAFLLTLLLGAAEHGVLAGLGDAELDHFLGWDLDRFACRGVASHSGLTVDQYQLA